jgi:hypothetical protein
MSIALRLFVVISCTVSLRAALIKEIHIPQAGPAGDKFASSGEKYAADVSLEHDREGTISKAPALQGAGSPQAIQRVATETMASHLPAGSRHSEAVSGENLLHKSRRSTVAQSAASVDPVAAANTAAKQGPTLRHSKSKVIRSITEANETEVIRVPTQWSLTNTFAHIGSFVVQDADIELQGTQNAKHTGDFNVGEFFSTAGEFMLGMVLMICMIFGGGG